MLQTSELSSSSWWMEAKDTDGFREEIEDRYKDENKDNQRLRGGDFWNWKREWMNETVELRDWSSFSRRLEERIDRNLRIAHKEMKWNEMEWNGVLEWHLNVQINFTLLASSVKIVFCKSSKTNSHKPRGKLCNIRWFSYHFMRHSIQNNDKRIQKYSAILKKINQNILLHYCK